MNDFFAHKIEIQNDVEKMCLFDIFVIVWGVHLRHVAREMKKKSR